MWRRQEVHSVLSVSQATEAAELGEPNPRGDVMHRSCSQEEPARRAERPLTGGTDIASDEDSGVTLPQPPQASRSTC